MWSCRKCGKPVYFAERKTSMGYEWHPECLRCEECGKRLNPGQHAEHKGVPYCHVPCYSVLFGPTLFGHGSQVEAHTSFGKVENRQGTSSIVNSHLEAKLRVYNQFYENKSGTIQSRVRNCRLILEGSIHIFWGVNSVIRLKEDHDDRITVRRRSVRLNRKSSTDDDLVFLKDSSPTSNDPSSMYNTLPTKLSKLNFDPVEDTSEIGRNYKTLPISLKTNNDSGSDEVVLRPKKSSRAKLRRRCSINGHFYNRETSVFMPDYSSVTSVWVSSLVNAPEVINLLLDKFKVENPPSDFALFIVRDTGERRLILDQEYPLLVRVMLGPDEDVAKIFIMNRQETQEIPFEVAQYLNFSEVELKAFVQKFCEEEEREMDRIKSKYEDIRRRIKARMLDLKDVPVKIVS